MGGVTGGALYITDSNGNPNVFKVEHNDNGSWLNANNANPDNRWNDNNRFIFVSRNCRFLSYFLGEFCFASCAVICPLQPPSILPISSIFVEMKIYFLSFNESTSQRIRRKTAMVFTFLIANLIHGNFSSFGKNPAMAKASIVSENRLSTFCPKEYLCIRGIV